MPNWKKLIVSGSEATLNSLTVTTTGSFYDDLTISGSNSSLILKSDGNKFARLTHNGDGLVIDGSVQNQYISIGSPTWNWPNGVRVYGDLQQSGSAGNTATFEGPTQATVNLKTTTGNKNNYIVGTTTGNISFRPNGTESVLLKSGGNVGIGTNNPRTKLEIGGSGTLGAVTNKVISATFDGGFSTTNSLQYNVNAFIGTTFGTTDIFASTSSETNKNFYTGLVSGNSYFNASRYSVVQGGAERLTVAIGGNVGIGSSVPVAPLDVFGAAVQNGSTPGIKLSSSNSSQTVFAIGNTGTRQYELAVGGTGSSVPGAFYIYDNDVSNFRVVLATSGNVGIGNTAPTYKLVLGGNGSLDDSIKIGTYQVAKNTRQYIGYSRADTGLFETGAAGNNASTVLSGVAGIRISNTAGTVVSSQADNSVQLLTHIYNGGSRVALHADANGNVGIGTTTPSTKLHIAGGLFHINESGNSAFYGGNYVRVFNDQNYGFRNAGGTAIANISVSGNTYFNGSGNFGFGTTNPYAFDTTATRLHVKNSGSSGAVSEVARFEGSSDADGSGGTIRLGTSNDRGIYFEGGRTGTVPYGKIGTTEYDGAKTLAITLNNSGHVTFAGELTANDDINASTKIVIGESSAAELRLKKTNAGVAKVTFWSDNSEKGYLELDASEDMVYYASSSIKQVFYSNAQTTLTLDSKNATFAGSITLPEALKASGNNLKFFAGGTHVFNVDVNRNIYPNSHNSTDLGFSPTLAFRQLYLSGNISSTAGASFGGNVFLPDNKYSIYGGASNAWELQIGVVGDNAFIEKTATTNGDLYIKNNGSGKGIIFQNGNATALTIDSSQNATFTGDVVVAGTLTAQEFKTELVSSSIVYESGSTKFGDSSDDIHSFSGSLRVTGSGVHYFTNGNVGIGTTSPGKNLEVAGSYKLGTNAYIQYDAGYPYTITTANTAAIGNLVFNAGAGSSGYESKIELQGANNAASASITLTAGSTAAMVVKVDGSIKIGQYGSGTVSGSLAKSLGVDSSGNIIEFSGGSGGTVSSINSAADTRIAFFNGSDSLEGSANFTWDDTKLQVNGGISVGAGSTRSQISGPTSGNANMTFAANAGNVNTATSEFIFTNSLNGSNTRVERMRINSTGQVGIGETNIDARLHISALSSSGLSNVKLESPGSSKWVFGIPASQTYFALDDVNDNLTTSKLVVLKTSGNVGIGTTSPGTKLTVEGDTKIQRSGNTAAFLTLNPNSSALGTTYQWNLVGTNSANNYQFQIREGSTTYLTIGNSAGGGAGNVGIGTTSPTKQLHLKRTTGDVRGIMVETSVATSYAEVQVKAAREFRIGTGGSSTTPNGQFYVYDATAGAHRFDINAAGNVGIGTISPAKKLVVKSTGADDGIVVLRNATSGVIASVIETGSGDGALLLANNSAATSVLLRGSGNNYINSGNVGIGTTSPIDKLAVNGGTGNTTNQDAKIALVRVSSTGNVLAAKMVLTTKPSDPTNHGNLAFQVKTTASSGESSAYYTDAMTIDGNNANVGIGLNNPSSKLTVSGAQELLQLTRGGGSDTKWFFSADSTRLFIAEGTSATANVKLAINENGNVGIGSSNPTSKLDILGTVNSGLFSVVVKNSNSGADAYVSKKWLNNDAAHGEIWRNSSNRSSAGQGALSFNMYNSADINFWSGTSHTMALVGNNVGIGTTAPSQKLHVHATSGDGLLRVSGDNIATSGGEIKGFNNGFAFNVAPSGGGTYVERMRINGAGSVGIGTHTPFTTGGVTKLALYSTTNLLSMGLSNTDMSYIRRQGTGEFQWQTYKGSNDGELQLQPYGGKVGIGTTSPSHKFHVNGDAKATTYYGQNIALTQAASASGVQHAFYSLHTSNNTIRVSQYGQSHSASPAVNQIGVSNAEQHLHLVTDSNTNILAGTSTKGIFLRSGGNVGIGTRSPDYKFDVAGDIQNNGVFRKGGNVIIKSTGSETRIGPGGSGIVTFHNSATMTAGDETVRIDASGNLMLNNTSAGARLDIREDSGYAIRAENASGHYFRVNSGGDTEIAGDLTVAGILTAQEFHTELVSASIVYESGSTKFGNTSDDIHDFTGSLKVLGSVNSTSAGISNFERLHINSLQSWSAQDLGSASSGSVAFRINGRSGATNDFIISTAQGTANYTMQVVGNATTSGQLHINPFGGNVGIGTNSAGEILSVAGNAEIYSGTSSGYLNVGRNAQERITLQVDDNTNTINATNDSDGNGAHNFVLDRNFAGTGANNFLINKAGSTQMLIDTNGNVGIGATPRTIGTYRVLDISGTAGGYIGLSSGSTQQGELYSHSGGVDLVTLGAKYTRFYNNGGEKMRIHSSGNVGIGNTLDINKLDVSGNINLHGGNGGNLTFNNGDANITVSYNNANSVVGRDLSFKTYKAGVGNTEKMRITRDGDIGFGTTVVTNPGLWYDGTNKYLAISHWATPPTPAALLHISDNANNVDVPQIRIEGRENPGDTKLDISVRDPQVRFNLVEGSTDANNGYGLMTFKTNAIPNAAVNRGGFNFEVGATGGGVVQALTITNQSNVGIGTPTPQKKLHIEGPGGASASQVLVTGASDTIGSTAGILLRAESGEGDSALRAKGGIFFERTAANGLGKLHFANNGSNNNDSATLANSRMTILNNGNVGIGTTSPTNKLTVDDTIGIKRSGVAAITTLQQTGTGLILNAPSGYHPLVIKYNGSEKARFNNSGALHVVGDISGSGQLFVNTGTDTGDILQVKGNNNVFAARLDGSTTGGQSYGLRVRAGTNSVDAGLLIENTSGTDLFKVTGEGHVQIVSANISYHQNTDVDSSAAEVIATVSTGSYTGAFFDYTCVSGSNARIGTVMAVNVAGSVEFTDNSSDSIGVTSGVVLTVDISGGNMRLKAATTTNNWNIKTLVRSL